MKIFGMIFSCILLCICSSAQSSHGRHHSFLADKAQKKGLYKLCSDNSHKSQTLISLQAKVLVGYDQTFEPKDYEEWATYELKIPI